MKENTQLNPVRFREAAAYGLRVFPVLPGEKKPAVTWTDYKERAPSAEQLARWDASRFGVGIICGAESGIAVLDVDSAEAQELVDSLDLPATPTVRTGKGVHYYFRLPSVEIRNRVKIAGFKLDVRGEGGFVVGPGSIHPSGATYDWIVSPRDVPFADFPSNLIELLRSPAKAEAGGNTRLASNMPITGRFGLWLEGQLRKACESLQKVEEGGRNNALFLAAVRLAKHVAASGADWTQFASPLGATAIEAGLEEAEVSATLASAWRTGSQEPTPWIKLAQEWIYISGLDQFRHLESGASLRPAAFRTEFGWLNPQPDVSIIKFLTDNRFITKVQDVECDPQQEIGVVEKDGRCWLNVYRPSAAESKEGDPTPFAEFLEFLVPAPEEREHLLKMLAHLVQRPGQKLGHALILGSRDHGVGKSTLLQIVFELLGPHNCRKATTQEMESQYQSYVEGKLLVLVEEINFGVGHRAYNALKDLISSEQSPVRRLYQDTREVRNMATFVFLTNLDTPILIEREDRRFFVIDSPALRREPAYYQQFNGWWRENLGVIKWYLESIDLEGFDRFAPPPVTAAKIALIENSRAPLIQEIMAMIEEREPPFHVDIVIFQQIYDALQRRGVKISRKGIEDALRKIGAVALGQHRLPKDVALPHWLSGIPNRPSLWVIRNAQFWPAATHEERVAELLAREGRLSDLPELPEGLSYSPMSALPPVRAQMVPPEVRLAALIRELHRNATVAGVNETA